MMTHMCNKLILLIIVYWVSLSVFQINRNKIIEIIN